MFSLINLQGKKLKSSCTIKDKPCDIKLAISSNTFSMHKIIFIRYKGLGMKYSNYSPCENPCIVFIQRNKNNVFSCLPLRLESKQDLLH